jgi:hypothetical protein
MAIIKTREDDLLASDRSKTVIAHINLRVVERVCCMCEANAARRRAADSNPCRRYAAGAADSRNAVRSLE